MVVKSCGGRLSPCERHLLFIGLLAAGETPEAKEEYRTLHWS